MKKRIISFLLCVCMVASLLPAFPIAFAAKSVTYTYDLTPNDDTTSVTGFTTYESAGGMWKYHSRSANCGTINGMLFKDEWMVDGRVGLGGWFAIEIDVPTSGEYKAELLHGTRNKSGPTGQGYVYIFPADTADIDAAIESGNGALLSAYVKYSASSNKSGIVTKLSDEVNLEAGKYIMVFSCSEVGAASGTYIYPQSVALTCELPWTPPVIDSEYAGKAATKNFVFALVSNSWENPVVKLKAAETGDKSANADLRGITSEFTDGWYAYAWNTEYSRNNNGGYKENRSFYQASSGLFRLIATAKDGFHALAFPLEGKGRYDIEISYDKDNGIADVYFIPMSELSHNDGKAYYYLKLDDEVLTDEEKLTYPALPQERIDEIASLIATDEYKIGVLDSPAFDGTKKVMSVDVKESGDHLLVFKKTEAGNTGNIISKIKFSGEPVVQEVKKNQLIAEKKQLLPGESTALSLADKFGTPIDEFEIVEISSDDESVATVEGKTVTAGDKFGRANISAKVRIGGKEDEAVGFVRVINTADAEERISHRLDLKNNNARGETWVNPSYYIYPELYKNQSRANNDICGYEEGHGITSDYTDGWAWYGRDENIVKNDMTFNLSSGSFLRATLTKGQWFALKINLPAEGHYRATLGHLAYNALGAGIVYLAPIPKEGEKVEDYLTDAYKIGEFDCYDANHSAWNDGDTARNTYLGDAYVEEAGEHILIIQSAGATYSLLMMNSITLSGAFPVAGLNNPDALTVGGKLVLDKKIIDFEDDIPEYTEECSVSFVNNTPEIIDVSGNTVTALANGIGKITVIAEWRGKTEEFELSVVVGSSKTRRTYYTDEKVANARRNIERYDWAKQQMKTVVAEADRYVELTDKLWDYVTTQELPRAQMLTARFNDSGYTDCLYCRKELETQYGSRPFKRNAIAMPWKLQCPDCGRKFPSNDFGKFYELGIDEHANWDYELALQKHHEMFVCADGENCSCVAPEGKHTDEAWRTYYGYGVRGGYLYNDLYGEKNDPLYAVDDGWGYEYTYYFEDENGNQIYNEDGTPRTENRIEPFIAYYNYYGIWDPYGQGFIYRALTSLSEAYVYTGEEKYGIAGAILVDRIADVYSDFDVIDIGLRLPVADNSYKQNADGTLTGLPHGIILGKLHDIEIAVQIIKAYDAFWPALKNPKVISYLSDKAKKYDFENPKTNEVLIANNFENNFIRFLHESRLKRKYQGNFPGDQEMHILAGIVLDSSPETEEWIEFEFKSGGPVAAWEYTGGNIASQIMGIISRDGHGNEAAPGYNAGWVTNLMTLGDILNGCDKIPEEKKTLYDIFSNPKYLRMLTGQIEILCATTASPNIGDHDSMGRHLISFTNMDALILALERTEDPEMKKNIARLAYRVNGNKTDGIHGGIFMEEPEAIVGEIKKAVGDSSAIILPSENFGGYGLAILRAGDWYLSDDPRNNVNTQRDFYIWYGRMSGHGHQDKLGLTFHAYGLEVGADPGEPAVKDNNSAQRYEFDRHTVSHNTVMVNNLPQRNIETGYPNHFDDAGKVKVMDVENAAVYDWQGVEEYRRTLVMVDANDDISYGVDFFHILGGEDHLYSFHAMGREAELSDNVEVTSQKDESGNYIGSYQGIDKGWGESNINSLDIKNAYGGRFGVYDIDRDLGGVTDGLGSESWFGEVDRAVAPEEADVFSMDWSIVDQYNELEPAQKDLRVRLTMLNSFKLDEITASSGKTANKPMAIDKVRYLFARHTGENDGRVNGEKLDTLFTSVIEPYNKDRYIDSIEKVTIERADGAEFKPDEAKAVKVTLKNGRVDYIVFAKDTTVPYKVYYSETESFDFCGFVGVVSMFGGKITYSYINDGTAIADKTGLEAAYTGRIADFQKEYVTDNYIDVSFDGDADIANLAGRYIYVDNAPLEENAAYLIKSAEKVGENVRLNLGNTTLISSFADVNDFDKGYKYNISENQSFRIPLSYVEDESPVFDSVSETLSTSAGSSISVKVSAENSADEVISYSVVSLPRGASFDSESGTIMWKPTSSQLGKNLFRIDATDESGRSSRLSFIITVYGSTVGGAGGGGGGSAPSQPENNPTIPATKPDEKDNSTSSTDNGNKTPSVGDADSSLGEGAGNVRFVDLGAHDWAADAINALADEGIIKGTSENTFSPAANITRADFAILLVRAFKLASENEENFADVSSSDYFAKELAVARNTGLVNGIGENKFAPRNNITRQDMMVIVYRALNSMNKLDVGDGVLDVPQAPDFDQVSDYAKDAVSALVNAKLVNGKNGLIDPTAYTTRAEVAVLIKRILDFIK